MCNVKSRNQNRQRSALKIGPASLWRPFKHKGLKAWQWCVCKHQSSCKSLNKTNLKTKEEMVKMRAFKDTRKSVTKSVNLLVRRGRKQQCKQSSKTRKMHRKSKREKVYTKEGKGLFLEAPSESPRLFLTFFLPLHVSFSSLGKNAATAAYRSLHRNFSCLASR